MWKPSIYLGASIFDMILSDNQALKRSAYLLLELCKGHTAYVGHISPYTIYELSFRCSDEQMTFISDTLIKYDILYIQYLLPKEIDYLANRYIESKFLPASLTIDYYQIASSVYLNLENYICYNSAEVINQYTYSAMFRVSTSNGYRGISNYMHTPDYLTRRACLGNADEVISQTLTSKIKAADKVQEQPLGDRSTYVQTIADTLLSANVQRVVMPIRDNDVARIPMLDLTEIPLKFKVRSFEEEIQGKEIPLLDLDEEETGYQMENYLYKLELEEGAALLKNQLLGLIYHYPMRYTEEEHNKISNERNKKFIDWLLPQIKAVIDPSGKPFEEIKKEVIRHHYYHGMDQQIVSGSFDDKNIVMIKRKAIELVDFMVQGNWKKYVLFTFTGHWCSQNEIFYLGEDTRLMIERDGKEIWVLLLNAVIHL